jgi:hypothetical protein
MTKKNVDITLSEIDALMDEIVDKVFEKTQQNLVDDGKIDTGTLIQTGNINREFLYKQIVYPAEHASVVNYGREAGATPPPVAPLITWVRRKLSVKNDKEAKSIAFAISKAIHQRGIVPTFFVENAVEEVIREYD